MQRLIFFCPSAPRPGQTDGPEPGPNKNNHGQPSHRSIASFVWGALWRNVLTLQAPPSIIMPMPSEFPIDTTVPELVDLEPQTRKPHVRAVALALCFLLLPTVILAGAWRLGGVSALEDDLLYYLPIRQYIGERIRAGEWPLWNPLVGMGTSLAADPQSGLWYPPTWLFVVLPPLIAYPVTLILHFALAGWGMYRFLRALGRDTQVALLGAIGFEFCGFLIAHRAHLTIHEATAWIPWILLAWQRFTATGSYKHWAMATLFLGLQMLVQHTQVSIMTAMLVGGYAACVLWPRRLALIWQFPLSVAVSAGLAAVQIVPTAYHLLASGRSTPTFATFVENSWAPSSALMLLFPMVYGSRTPSIWGTWWGVSHFCEQSAYGSILILLLAGASLGLVRSAGKWNRELLFWWGAGGLALIVALGDTTPVAGWLFHLPVYRSLRVPARWLLVWSLAMPVLATGVAASIRRGGAEAGRARATLRWMATSALPSAALMCLVVLIVARLLTGRLEAAYGDRWGAKIIFAGLRSAIRPGNPSLWGPIVVMLLSSTILLRGGRRYEESSREGIPAKASAGCKACANRPRGSSMLPLFAIMLIDLAGVAAFVDIDSTTYTRGDLDSPPPLVHSIAAFHPDPGHRLLVPRYQADYAHPHEVLWPETNLRQGVPTFNAYGPFWPRENRLLFRFMPWGSSEAMLELLRNTPLCAAMGIRFIAARSPEERSLVRAALADAVPFSPQAIVGTEHWQPVRAGHDVKWPIRIDQAGIYRLRFEAAPGPDTFGQWFIRLETPDVHAIGWTRRLEPVDLSAGPRIMEFLFICPEPAGAAFVRIKSEAGQGLSVRSPEFGRVAEEQDAATEPVWIPRGTADGVDLYEVPGAVPLVRLSREALPVASLSAALDHARYHLGADTTADVYESTAYSTQRFADEAQSEVLYARAVPERIEATVRSQAGSLLVFNESWNPGWRATVGGLPTPVLRVNAVVQGVAVPSGESQVILEFRPRGLAAGALGSVASLGILLSGCAICTRASNRKKVTII